MARLLDSISVEMAREVGEEDKSVMGSVFISK